MKFAIRAAAIQPLEDMKVVCYYGCLLTRPPQITGAADWENPVLMDELMELIGTAVRPWSYKTECCGASLSLTRSDIVSRLVGNLVEAALEAGAEAIVTACPLCQANLDMRQTGRTKIPVYYFTELMALAFGESEARKWIKGHMIR